MRNSSKTLLFLFSGTIMTFAQVGNVGINTDSPTNALHVVSTANPLRLQGLQTGATTDNLLTVDATGVVRQNSSVKGLLVGTYTAFGTNPVTILKETQH